MFLPDSRASQYQLTKEKRKTITIMHWGRERGGRGGTSSTESIESFGNNGRREILFLFRGYLSAESQISCRKDIFNFKLRELRFKVILEVPKELG